MQMKYLKKYAEYRKAYMTAKHKCGNCKWRKGLTCGIVRGPIDKEYTCKFWKGK